MHHPVITNNQQGASSSASCSHGVLANVTNRRIGRRPKPRSNHTGGPTKPTKGFSALKNTNTTLVLSLPGHRPRLWVHNTVGYGAHMNVHTDANMHDARRSLSYFLFSALTSCNDGTAVDKRVVLQLANFAPQASPWDENHSLLTMTNPDGFGVSMLVTSIVEVESRFDQLSNLLAHFLKFAPNGYSSIQGTLGTPGLRFDRTYWADALIMTPLSTSESGYVGRSLFGLMSRPRRFGVHMLNMKLDVAADLYASTWVSFQNFVRQQWPLIGLDAAARETLVYSKRWTMKCADNGRFLCSASRMPPVKGFM